MSFISFRWILPAGESNQWSTQRGGQADSFQTQEEEAEPERTCSLGGEYLRSKQNVSSEDSVIHRILPK